jgi:hypothetical protein
MVRMILVTTHTQKMKQFQSKCLKFPNFRTERNYVENCIVDNPILRPAIRSFSIITIH